MIVRAIELATVTGLATVQDGGRRGHLHQGVPPGGALVPEALGSANAAVDNPAGAAAIEAFGPLRITARGPLRIGHDDGTTVREINLHDGETIDLGGAGGRVTYVAVRGGIDVPVVLGGRGTLLCASLGGHEGRALRRGDRLGVGAIPECSARSLGYRRHPADPIAVVPGPDLDLDPTILDRLLASSYRIDPCSNRVGIRLDGPRFERAPSDRGPSRPMVRGAIQLPPDGVPIVLGPDHPTTGGYPVPATVRVADLGRLGALPIGAAVRFAATPRP